MKGATSLKFTCGQTVQIKADPSISSKEHGSKGTILAIDETKICPCCDRPSPYLTLFNDGTFWTPEELLETFPFKKDLN